MPTLLEIVGEIDRRSMVRPFGTLQDRRKRIHGLRRKPSSVPFRSANDEAWAFHVGGRKELQFNLGLEDGLPGGDLRYGVAFSFEPSQTLPQIDELLPKAARFNDYLLERSVSLSGLRMWHFGDARREETRTGPYSPAPITPNLFRNGVFIFLGRIGQSADPDYEAILDTLDALLPLWEFVETDQGRRPLATAEPPLGRRVPSERSSVSITRIAMELDVELRHNELQRRLHGELVETYGRENVDVEFEVSGGGRVDAIVEAGAERILFEIKTASTARGCVREALGQILDYGCWPGRIPATRLVIVGAPALDVDVQRYLTQLSASAPAKIEYKQVILESD